MKIAFRCPSVLAGIFASASLFALGCTSAKKPVGPLVAETAPPPRFVTSEYEYVNVTGSQIPIRVPKGAGITGLPTSSPVSVMSGEDFRAMMQRSQGRR